MSKENANLRLLGSPVNLSYRNKKKEDRKNIRNRPRSAVNNSSISQDTPERYKRPFSADTKERGQSTRSYFKAFSAEVLQSYNNSPIKVVAPTLEILGEPNATDSRILRKDKELCSNASDYGSEDTFISLGTKIKAKAQLSPKPKLTNPKTILKYRNIARKNRKPLANEEFKQAYGMEVKITERSPSPTKGMDMFDRSLSPTQRYESYFVPLQDNGDLGRISLSSNIDVEVEQAIDKYSRRLAASKQQLSLVEEESTQDVDSGPSQNLSSLSPENSLQDAKNCGDIDDLTGRKTYVVDDIKIDFGVSKTIVRDPRTYTHFYDDFQVDPYKCKLSSTVVHTDSSSKDSGYPDSGPNDEKLYRQNYSLPTTSLLKTTNVNKTEDQPKSLDSISTNSSDQTYRNSLDKNKQWTEPLNHSRLLYKDFFLKKEGHIAVPPQNSPNKNEEADASRTGGVAETKVDNISDDTEYPSYLVNSTTKAYTSKVIEDYKRELETINNLHELTIKDIKADAVSPTPLNIDKLFDDHSNFIDTRQEHKSTSSHQLTSDDKNKNSLDTKKRDVSKISTKELIQNYFKVKEGDFKGHLPKNIRKKTNNITIKDEITTCKQEWNNKTSINSPKNIPVIRNQTQKNVFTMRTPLSARIEGVQNDKDIDSWMSLSAPSPTLLDIEETATPTKEAMDTEVNAAEEKFEDDPSPSSPTVSTEKDTKSVKELSTNSTVLDIYSMLKEIESYGDNPVTSVTQVESATDRNVAEEMSPTPKDNFMEIFEFLEKVEQSANDALSVVTNTTPQTIPKLEGLLKLPQTELAQRLVTATLQLEERSCCIALLQESLANHKEQMIQKVGNLEKQSQRNISKVKQECEETIKRHQSFIDQLINDKKTLNHRIEQLVDERRSAEERWKRSAQVLEDRYKLELRNQHDKMAAAQQVARQRWVRQKAEKIKELTVKGLEGELREMAERQQKEVSDLKMHHAEMMGKYQAKHAQELEELRRQMEEERETALVKERQLGSSRLEKQILELEVTYQEQRTRLIAEMRAENERVAAELAEKERAQREEFETWRKEQEKLLEEARTQLDNNIALEKQKLDEQMKQREKELQQQFEQYKKDFEAEQQMILKKKVTEISTQHKQERDREIEKAIESMEAEAQAGRKDLQEALRRNKEQYELELKELAETEQATLRRYQDAQARVRQTEDRCAELEVTISQLETRNRVLTEKNTQLESRALEIRASCEQTWRTNVDNLKKEMEEMKKTHEEQMHQLYAKVKVAVARKDSAIQALTRESAKYQEKITILEQKLQQQRKDFLKQK